MKTIRFRINGFGIEYDQDYGIDHRRGWSVIRGGSYVVTFQKYLFMALLRAIV